MAAMMKTVQRAYAVGKRRVKKLVRTLRARMPARLSADDYVALAGVHALVAATDVRSIVFLRVSSGWPAVRKVDCFRSAMPYRWQVTEPLPLLPEFTRVGELPLAPAGFVALHRLLHMEPTEEPLSSDVSAPMTSLRVVLPVEPAVTAVSSDDSAAVPATVVPRTVTLNLKLLRRLGVGGSSDVYHGVDNSAVSLDGSAGDDAVTVERHVVVKVPRFTSRDIVAQFETEAKVLRSLAAHGVNGVPVVAVLGTTSNEAVDGVHWPVLLFDGPVGRSLDDAVKGCASDAEREAFADKVVSSTPTVSHCWWRMEPAPSTSSAQRMALCCG
jgi:hypothetical protein